MNELRYKEKRLLELCPGSKYGLWKRDVGGIVFCDYAGKYKCEYNLEIIPEKGAGALCTYKGEVKE